MKVTPIKTRVFKANEDLLDFIRLNIKKIKEGSVLAVTSKIVALSEGEGSANQKREHGRYKNEIRLADYKGRHFDGKRWNG
jgi:F420-0:gamma-glutamyl ligase